MAKRAMKQGCKYLWFLAAAVIVVTALLLSVARGITPMLSQYRPQLQALASEAMHQPVKIGEVSASWRGFSPTLQFTNVMVLGDTEAHSILNVKHLTVGLDIFSSLWHWRLIPGELVASGASITVRQHGTGEVTIDGVNPAQTALSQLNGGHPPAYVMQWLLSQEKIALRDVDVHWVGANGVVVPIENLSLELLNDGEQHQVRGFGQLAQTVPSQFYFVIKFTGEPNDIEHWRGRAYVHAKDMVFGQWLQDVKFDGVTPGSGQLSFHLWLDWQNNALNSAQVEFDAQNLNLQTTPYRQHFVKRNSVAKNELTNDSVLMQQLAGHLMFERTSSGWRLYGDKIKARIGGEQWPSNQFSLRVDEQGWQLALGYLQAQAFMPLLWHNSSLSREWRQVLRQLAPRGELYNAIVDYRQDAAKWQIQTAFENIQLNAWQHVPAINGLTGELGIAPQQGFLRIDSQQAQFEMGQLFRQPWPIETLKGELSWQQDNSGWWLWGDGIEFKNADMAVNTEFSWHRSAQESSGPGELSMVTGFSFENTQHLDRYLPAKLPEKDMSTKLVHWLEQAFSGTGDGVGTMVLRGPLTDFPFAHHEGTFLIDANINNMDLSYDEKWPRAKQLFGELIFRQRSMMATIFSGDLAGIPLKNLSLTIPYLQKDKEVLHIQGAIKTQAEKILAYLLSSPLKKRLSMLSQLQLAGATLLNVDLTLPFKNMEKDFILGGTAELDQATLKLPQWKVAAQAITGVLKLSKEGLSAEQVKAKLFGTPVDVSLKPLIVGKQHRADEIKINGKINSLDLKKKITSPWLKNVAGTTDYQATIIIPTDEQQALTLSLSSSLQNIHSPLPFPFYTVGGRKLPLKLQLSLVNDRLVNINVNLADKVKAALAFVAQPDGWVLQRGNVHFGAGKAVLPKQARMLINGELSQFSLSQWMPYLQQLTMSHDKRSLPYRLDITLGQAELFSHLFSKLHITANPSATQWKVHVDGPQAKGEIIIPHQWRRGIVANMQRLFLQPITKPAKRSKLSPTDIPPLNVSVRELSYNNKHFDKVKLITQTRGQTLVIKQLKTDSVAMTLQARGEWQIKKGQGKSTLQGSVTTKSLGQALRNLALTPVITAKSGLLDFDFHWAGAPYDISLAKLNGTALLKLNKGSITHLGSDAERKIGIGKLINILSVQSLPRRLMLDFGDISKKGFSYSTLQSHLNIKQGDAKLSATRMDGSVAFVAMGGHINLATSHYDMLVRITPQMTASLPILIAAIAGSPIAGVATFVASKIVNKAIQKSVMYTYKITGPWNKPTIKEVVANKTRHKSHKGVSS